MNLKAASQSAARLVLDEQEHADELKDWMID
jgi:hypothetical protein